MVSSLVYTTVLAEYTPDNNYLEYNYMEEMIQAATIGAHDWGKAAEIKRNEKIDALNLKCAKISYEDLYMLAQITYQEAGSSWLSDDHMRCVASVVLNRVDSPEFKNTIEEVLRQPGQYGTVWHTMIPHERAIRNAAFALQNPDYLPPDVVFQSEFSYLGGGIYKTIHDDLLGTTYLNYSYNRGIYE